MCESRGGRETARGIERGPRGEVGTRSRSNAAETNFDCLQLLLSGWHRNILTFYLHASPQLQRHMRWGTVCCGERAGLVPAAEVKSSRHGGWQAMPRISGDAAEVHGLRFDDRGYGSIVDVLFTSVSFVFSSASKRCFDCDCSLVEKLF